MHIKKLIIIFGLMIAIPSIIRSQPELKKRIISDKKNKTEEVFYVLKNNKDIRQGDYEKYMEGKLVEKGNYENNQKQIWSFFDFSSQLELKYDISKDSVLELNLDEKDFEVYLDKNTKIKVDRPALPLISLPELIYFVAINTEYPIEAQEKYIQGNVEIGIEIDENSKIIKYDIIKSADPLLDNEALRVVKSFPLNWNWLPALKDKAAIKSYYIVPVNFRLI